MRDTSIWTGDLYTGKPQLTMSVRQRYSGFHWRDGNTVYALSGLGEDWGDSPGTVIETRERDLPTRFRYGGFVVAGDSVTLSSGNILRVTSLAAGNQGTDLLWQEVSNANQLVNCNTLSLANSPLAWSGIGLTQRTGYEGARLFYVRGYDAKLVYQDYTPGTGFGTVYALSNSPTFNQNGVAIAPVSDVEAFIISYNPVSCAVTLHHLQYGDFGSYTMPMRYQQHPLNCHWFDAIPIAGNQSLVTFNVNGVQYATIFTGTGFRDPWPIMAFDVEFGGAQTRFCKLT